MPIHIIVIISTYFYPDVGALCEFLIQNPITFLNLIYHLKYLLKYICIVYLAMISMLR